MLILRICFSALLVFTLTACGQGGSSEPELRAADRFEGSATAKVQVDEYASVACPICAAVNRDIMPAFKKKYIDSGEVRYVYHPMLTANSAVAMAGHLLAQCAGEDKYFQVIDAIMRSQNEMNKGGAPEQYVNARPVLWEIGQSVGLTPAQFNACITDRKAIAQLQSENAAAISAGIDATPTFLVNGEKMELRKGDISDFDEAIAPLLK